MKIYIPTETELLEMGFRKSLSVWRKDIDNGQFKVIIQFGKYKNENIWTGPGVVRIYPRSKEHLEQIILAFKPE